MAIFQEWVTILRVSQKKVIRDAIRMWGELTGNLPGISVTSSRFSDGCLDLNPSQHGPVWRIYMNRSFCNLREADK